MAEENQGQQNASNNTRMGREQEDQMKEVPTLTSFIRQEIPQFKQMEEKEKQKEETHKHNK